MNSFLNPHNGTSLTGVIDITAHSMSIFQENESPQNIKDTFLNKNTISIAEPYDVQIDENGDNFITMYQFIGHINDTTVAGLESLLNYMNENFFSKDEPAVNEHQYHVTIKQYTEETHNIYNIDKSNLITLSITAIQMNIITIVINVFMYVINFIKCSIILFLI